VKDKNENSGLSCPVRQLRTWNIGEVQSGQQLKLSMKGRPASLGEVIRVVLMRQERVKRLTGGSQNKSSLGNKSEEMGKIYFAPEKKGVNRNKTMRP